MTKPQIVPIAAPAITSVAKWFPLHILIIPTVVARPKLDAVTTWRQGEDGKYSLNTALVKAAAVTHFDKSNLVNLVYFYSGAEMRFPYLIWRT